MCLKIGPEIGKVKRKNLLPKRTRNNLFSPDLFFLGDDPQGNFGKVYVAKLPDDRTVAVKRLRNRTTEEEAEDFFNEIKTMKRVGIHENIITLVACCTLRQPLLIVMEFFGSGGNLLEYLTEIKKRHYGLPLPQPPAMWASESGTESEDST